MKEENVKCSVCKELLPIIKFYLINDRTAKKQRYEKHCHDCKKRKRKLKTKSQKTISPKKENFKSKINIPNDKSAYKVYTYPNGQKLSLTKDEYYRVVDTYRTMINFQRKRNGIALLKK